MKVLKSVPPKRVQLTGGMLGRRARINREETLHAQHQKLEKSGRLDMLRRAAGERNEAEGHIFWDSDIAKWIEGVGCSLATWPDPELEKKADAVIELYARAQESDGYLNCYYSVFEPENRWSNLRDCHELYCAGHLMEAAVAYREGTGKGRLLQVMCRTADHIDSVFGPEPGKRRGYPGHEEIELALTRLYRATGVERYLKLAAFFVNERGTSPAYFVQEAERRGKPMRTAALSYSQAHKPVRDQEEAVGHAVRAVYLYSGMADVAAATGDAGLFEACQRLWQNITQQKMYVTGGIGAGHGGEDFGDNFELPNARAYAETCAAIGLVFFAKRMLDATARREYADVLERVLYNGVMAGLGLDGQQYFYVNPLSCDGETRFNRGSNQRQPWFDCSCCPTNLARFLPALGEYLYSTDANGLYVHLYASSQAVIPLDGGDLTLTQITGYPWNGDVTLTLRSDSPLRAALRLRLPDWCPGWELSLDGQAIDAKPENGWLTLDRVWQGEHRLALSLEMPVRRIVADPRVEAARGGVALQRGPVLYCAEQLDHEEAVHSLAIPDNASLTARHCPDLLGGCSVIEGDVTAVQTRDGSLYGTLDRSRQKPTRLRAIPYPLWANRGNHPMTVWFLRD